jgi:lambda family phage portal protein
MFGAQQITWNNPAPLTAAPPAPAAGRNVREVINSVRQGRIKARYDAALVTDDTNKQWGYVDFLSPKAANSREVRRLLRMRARYTIQNNQIAAGIIDTFCNDIVGKGPRLQVLFPDPKQNSAVQDAWNRWCRAVNLIPRLRVAVAAKKGDGEDFFIKKTNRAQNDAVKVYHLDLESDQIQTITPMLQSGFWVDGMELSPLGLPVTYHVLKRHPGDLTSMGLNYSPLESDRIPARYVIHWFKRFRPGQCRGIPELTPSLNLFEQLRRFDKATLTAAEWAAVMSAVLETELAPEDQDSTALGAPWDTWEPDVGTISTLPAGYKLKQMVPQQPGSSHKEFTDTLTRHAARPVGMPFNVATCDSSGYNFSSGRLDHLPYHRQIEIERIDMEQIILDQMMADWLDEAVMIPGYFGPYDIPALLEQVPHCWHWPQMDSIDPQKDAMADAQNLANGTTSRTAICGRDGTEYRQVRRQQAEEIAYDLELAKELGLQDNWADGLRPNMPTPTEADNAPDPAPAKPAAKKKAVAA